MTQKMRADLTMPAGTNTVLYLIVGNPDNGVVVLPPASQYPAGFVSVRRIPHGKKVIVRPNGSELLDGGWADKNQYVLEGETEVLTFVSDGTCWYLFASSRRF
jgi:hypothetical protein